LALSPTSSHGGGAQTVLSVTVTLDDAEIRALPTTEEGPFPGTVEVLPAVAVDERVGFTVGYLTAYNTTAAWVPYLDSIGSDLPGILAFTDLPGNVLTLSAGSSVVLGQLAPHEATLTQDPGSAAGLPRTDGLLLLADSAGGAAWTGGHADNRLAVTVLYTVVTLA
jgi:hypothetical protein